MKIWQMDIRLIKPAKVKTQVKTEQDKEKVEQQENKVMLQIKKAKITLQEKTFIRFQK